MELRVLRYFVEAAKEENMTRAAERLHVTQPTLSRQLKDLEQELGQKLFTRSNYSIHLTPEGNLLYQRALDILDMADKTSAEFAAMQEFNGGDIHIGCAESEGISYIAKAFRRLQQRCPNVHIHLYSGNAEQVTTRLDKGLLDFAVVVQNIDISEYSALALPSKDRWGVIMRKDSRFVSCKEIPIEKLAELPLIVSRQGLSQEMPGWFQENYERLNIVATYDLLYNASVLVKENIGYALGFDKLIDTGADSVLCFRPLVPSIESPMHLIWNRSQVFSKAAELLLDTLREND
jgi:Transcriptional regulator